jgi:hypothetical protein
VSPDDISRRAAAMVRRCAAPAEGLTIAAQISRAARRLRWHPGRAKKIWYGEARLRVEEWEELRQRVAELERRSTERTGLVNEIRGRLESARSREGGGDC